MIPNIEQGDERISVIEQRYLTLFNDMVVEYHTLRMLDVSTVEPTETFSVTRYRDCKIDDKNFTPESGVFKRLNDGKRYNSREECNDAINKDLLELSKNFGYKVDKNGVVNEN